MLLHLEHRCRFDLVLDEIDRVFADCPEVFVSGQLFEFSHWVGWGLLTLAAVWSKLAN